jgi:hypothetical protein
MTCARLHVGKGLRFFGKVGVMRQLFEVMETKTEWNVPSLSISTSDARERMLVRQISYWFADAATGMLRTPIRQAWPLVKTKWAFAAWLACVGWANAAGLGSLSRCGS